MNMQKTAQKGFTLIELMIVIAIVGILAAIALPAYQDYIVRSKMSEPLASLAEAKTTIAEYVAANGRWPTPDNTPFGIDTGIRTRSEIIEQLEILPAALNPGDTVYVVAWVDSCIWDGSDCDPTTAAKTHAFSLSGSTNSDGTMNWDCVPGDGTGNEVETKYLPANCRG